MLDYQNFDLEKSICLSLPNNKRFYTWEYNFPPYFESFLPEGYLYEVFKNFLTKEYGYIDDYLVFSLLCSSIESRVSYVSEFHKIEFPSIDIEEILNNDTQDTFRKILDTFLYKNAISGVQAKSFAIVNDKDTFQTKEYIVKTWAEEFPYLAENEYFCLKAVQKAGLSIPNIKLSKNKRFLLVENFIFKDKKIYGFEEILSLMGKNRIYKYEGSYEQISKVIYQFCTDKTKSLKDFYKAIVMNYLLKNGDAHLKNFGLLFSDDFKEIFLSPIYDVINTTSYIFKDKPALNLSGKKLWYAKDSLVDFGQKNCLLSKKEALFYYAECENALLDSIKDLQEYIKINPHFEIIGHRMIKSWELSLLNEDTKEISDDIIRYW